MSDWFRVLRAVSRHADANGRQRQWSAGVAGLYGSRRWRVSLLVPNLPDRCHKVVDAVWRARQEQAQVQQYYRLRQEAVPNWGWHEEVLQRPVTMPSPVRAGKCRHVIHVGEGSYLPRSIYVGVRTHVLTASLTEDIYNEHAHFYLCNASICRRNLFR